ncbi:hypothetical protein BRC83_10450 [Halobacteriales archaeon QS_1_68_17]|nr:MAG: hypothetical protein BRC83_10450 [Halobacteriales archaeon QS_1_68_17]
MSADDGPGRREVAYRLFAAEFDDADFSYSESDEERAPNYVVTPTGARINRLFAVGVLTEVEQVSDDVLRARVVDPTGPFVIYAGQYQPDELAFLDRTDPPAFVAVTGKARTFQPDDSDRVFTSVRPESLNEVDAATRDRWVVGAAERTLDRVATFADALAMDRRGDDLRDVLVERGVDPGLAEGIALATEHYGTTPAYLAAVRDLATDAARVVSGDREEVEPLAAAPDEAGPPDLDALRDSLGGVDAGIEGASAAGTAAGERETGTASATGSTSAGGPDSAPSATSGAGAGDTAGSGASETEASTGTQDGDSGQESPVRETPTAGDESTAADSGPVDATAGQDAGGEAAGSAETGGSGASEDLGDFDPGEFDLDDDERERIEDEYGTEFETGTEVDEPGAADIEPEAAESGESSESGESGESGAPGGPEGTTEEPEPAGKQAAGSADGEEMTESPESGSEPDAEPGAGDADGDGATADSAGETADEADEDGEIPDAEDVDLEDAVMDAMRDLDDGDGADREAVIGSVVDDYSADRGDVEDAIGDALMNGRCYEPGDDRLKPI